MENNHDIDTKFNEASKALDEPATFPGFEKVWGNIEDKLEKKQNKKRIIPVWMPYGIAASLIIGLSTFYFINKENDTVTKSIITQNQFLAEDNPRPISENILKIDNEIKSNIQKEIVAPKTFKKVNDLPATVAYLPAAALYSPIVYEAKAQSMTIVAEPIVQNRLDTLKQKSIEEVIAMGIKKEKKSIVHSASMISSNSGYVSKMASVTDTAQFIPPNSLEKIVEPNIIAYNKANKKTQNNVSTTQVLAEKIGNKYIANSLQGSVSGLTINVGSGKVDSSNAIVIRGMSSLKENSNPLYVINGVVSDVKKFNSLDPATIVAITVLKDEKATSVYGSKAVNGVIVVETKDISKDEKKK